MGRGIWLSDLYSDCGPFMFLSGLTQGANFYQSNGFIETKQEVPGSYGNQLRLRSPTKIIFKAGSPGFSIKAGAYMHAVIGNCGQGVFSKESNSNTVISKEEYLKLNRNYICQYLFRRLPLSLIHLDCHDIPECDDSRLPSTLTYLNFRFHRSSRELPILPGGLKHLIFNSSTYDRQLPNLPDTLQTLELGDLYNNPLVLPNSLRKLIMGLTYNCEIANWPQSLRILVLGRDYNHPLVNLPDRLGRITCGERFNSDIVIPVGLKRLRINNRRYAGKITGDLSCVSFINKRCVPHKQFSFMCGCIPRCIV